MNAESRLLNKFQGGQFNRPVFSCICQYLPVNIPGMENTHICRHFANLVSDTSDITKIYLFKFWDQYGKR